MIPRTLGGNAKRQVRNPANVTLPLVRIRANLAVLHVGVVAEPLGRHADAVLGAGSHVPAAPAVLCLAPGVPCLAGAHLARDFGAFLVAAALLQLERGWRGRDARHDEVGGLWNHVVGHVAEGRDGDEGRLALWDRGGRREVRGGEDGQKGNTSDALYFVTVVNSLDRSFGGGFLDGPEYPFEKRMGFIGWGL